MSYEVENPDVEEMDVEDFGKLYAAVKMRSWEEAYQSFNSFVSQFKKEFGRGRMKGESIALYDEMMEKSQEALGLEGEYDDEVWDIQHAFLFGGNREIEIDEFREAVTDVLEEGEVWEYYAERSQP